MEEFTKLLEQAGFSVVNADDYKNIEIRDLKNNNELLQKSGYDAFSDLFRGSSDRLIVFSSNFSNKYMHVSCGNGLVVTKYLRSAEKSEYTISAALSDGTIVFIEINTFLGLSARNNGAIKVKVSQKNNESQILYSRDLVMTHRALETEFNTFSEFTDEREDKVVDTEICNTELYINTITNFLNSTQLTADNSKLQEGFKVVLPSISEDMDKIFINHRTHLEKYIEILERNKAAVIKEYQAKINSIDSNIERLKNLSQTQNKTI